MNQESFVPWGDSERQIFRFYDGTTNRAVDPAPVLRKLQKTQGLSLEADIALASTADAGEQFSEEGDKAIVRLVDATRKAMDIPPLTLAADGSVIGLTEAEVIAVLTKFGVFVGRLQEETRPLPSTPPVTEPAALANSVTQPGSDSISIAT